MQRIPLIGVVGDKEQTDNSISIRSLDGTNLGIFKLNELYTFMESLIDKKGRVH